MAQDLAEAIDSQVELAGQLRCYREENEKLLGEKQGVSVSHHHCFTVMQMNVRQELLILLNLVLETPQNSD